MPLVLTLPNTGPILFIKGKKPALVFELYIFGVEFFKTVLSIFFCEIEFLCRLVCVTPRKNSLIRFIKELTL